MDNQSTADFYTRETFAGMSWDVAEYNSVEEMADAAIAITESQGREASGLREQKAQALRGNQSIVDSSDKLLIQIEANIDIAGLTSRSMPAMVGGAPCVPAYLAGSPMAMRQRRKVAAPQGEIAIMMNTFATIHSSDVLKNRGAAFIALYRALSAVRPVSLYLYELQTQKTAVIIKVDTQTISLATTGWAAADVSFTLGLIIPLQINGPQNRTRGITAIHPATCDYTQEDVLQDWAEARGVSQIITTESLTGDRTGNFTTPEKAAKWVQDHIGLVVGKEAA